MFQRQGNTAYKKDLTNTFRLLEILDNPHQKFKSIHIAGTNGKGSSAHTIASILQEAGYKTGLYTSPHLKSFTERIRVDGLEISEGFVVGFVKKMKYRIEQIEPSFFEVTVAMAFQYFFEAKVDIAVIETGLGGRFDSTNVVEPLVSLITMIGHDHMDVLGGTLEQIAGEKAGIIKPNVPVVLGFDQRALYRVFENEASKKNAPIYYSCGIEIKLIESRPDYQQFSYSEGDKSFQFESDIKAGYYKNNLPGVFKVVEVLNSLGHKISFENILLGAKHVCGLTGLKGRWQLLGNKPKVVADISHNEPGLKMLLGQLNDIPIDCLHIVIGMVKDKDIGRVLGLLPTSASYYFTQSSVPRSLDSYSLMKLAHLKSLKGNHYCDVNEAIREAKNNAGKNDFILITGSTFVVAEIEEL